MKLVILAGSDFISPMNNLLLRHRLLGCTLHSSQSTSIFFIGPSAWIFFKDRTPVHFEVPTVSFSCFWFAEQHLTVADGLLGLLITGQAGTWDWANLIFNGYHPV